MPPGLCQEGHDDFIILISIPYSIILISTRPCMLLLKDHALHATTCYHLPPNLLLCFVWQQ